MKDGVQLDAPVRAMVALAHPLDSDWVGQKQRWSDTDEVRGVAAG